MNKAELVAFLKQARETATDQVALQGKELYSAWKAGENVKVGDRKMHNDILWKCAQAHTTQAGWEPSISTASLWTAINEEHAGTIEDPIPVPEGLVSFEYEWGKYYSESGTLYLCDRQGGKEGDTYRLTYKPSALIGHYFSVVEA